eukprot:753915-Hanusia_phi.AAC.32
MSSGTGGWVSPPDLLCPFPARLLEGGSDRRRGEGWVQRPSSSVPLETDGGWVVGPATKDAHLERPCIVPPCHASRGGSHDTAWGRDRTADWSDLARGGTTPGIWPLRCRWPLKARVRYPAGPGRASDWQYRTVRWQQAQCHGGNRPARRVGCRRRESLGRAGPGFESSPSSEPVA